MSVGDGQTDEETGGKREVEYLLLLVEVHQLGMNGKLGCGGDKTDDVPTTTSGEQQQTTTLVVPDYGAVGESETVVVAAEGSEAVVAVEVGVVTDGMSSSDNAVNDTTTTSLPWWKRTNVLILIGTVFMAIVASIATAIIMLLQNKTSTKDWDTFSEDLVGTIDDDYLAVENDAIVMKLNIDALEGSSTEDDTVVDDDEVFGDEDDEIEFFGEEDNEEDNEEDDGVELFGIAVGANEDDDVISDDNLLPEWSWDHVRTYVAVRRGDDYSDEQIEILAKQDIVMLEKMNGHETHGSIEAGTLVAAKRIKAVNPKVKILFYLNCMLHYGAYEANKYFKDDWAIKNPSTNKPYLWRGTIMSYDHTKPNFRIWWIQRGLDMLAHDEIDGIFIDAINKVQHQSLRRMLGDAWIEQHEAAYTETTRQLREKLPMGKLLIGNVLRASQFEGNYKNMQYLDGSYLENWREPNQLASTLQLMARALKEKYMIMLNADMTDTDFAEIDYLDGRYHLLNKPEFINFPLGFFLLVVEPQSYFSYHAGVDLKPKNDGKMLTVFDNTRFDSIMRNLGKPVGDYIDNGNGEYSRQFEYLKVDVNIITQQGILSVTNQSLTPTSPSNSPILPSTTGSLSTTPTLSSTTDGTSSMPTACLSDGERLESHGISCACGTLYCWDEDTTGRCCSGYCRITSRGVSVCRDQPSM